MASALAYLTRAALLTAADRIVSSPLYRWTWRPLAEEAFFARLPEMRPSDSLSASDMVAGKYLLGSRLVETGGVSPFSIATDDLDWLAELHGFAWLRHFSDVPAGPERAFARTLVLDWIGRFGQFDRAIWANRLTARRVQNWLGHYDLITGGASEKQRGIIARCLSAQVHSLSQRGRLDPDPLERLSAAIALVAVALSREKGRDDLPRRVDRLTRLLGVQLGPDGLHRSRSARHQFELLQYLAPLRLALAKAAPDAGRALAQAIERMHAALAALTLTTGEPAYFNGTGQLPLEVLLAVQSHGSQRAEAGTTRAVSGYGLLQQGRAKLVADGGAIPPVAYARHMHAGALAFEFGYGNELIVCNCGPAPSRLGRRGEGFRHSAAHSTLDMETISSARFGFGPLLGRHAFARARAYKIKCDPEQATVQMGTAAYVKRFGIRHARVLTLIDNGQTLIGQDMLTDVRTAAATPQPVMLRFHLGPGTVAARDDSQSLIRLTTKSGDSWVFLWEGAEAGIEASVRQSLHYGLVDTQQIVLKATVAGRQEVAWSFARQSG